MTRKEAKKWGGLFLKYVPAIQIMENKELTVTQKCDQLMEAASDFSEANYPDCKLTPEQLQKEFIREYF